MEKSKLSMPYFEEKYPENPRLRNAIKTLRARIDTGVFKIAVIRGTRREPGSRY